MSIAQLRIPATHNRQQWFVFINRALKIINTDTRGIVIDFNRINFLDPEEIVLLACLIERLKKNYSVEIGFINGSSALNHHLDNLKFKRYWTDGFKRNKFTEVSNSSTLCLWHISQDMIDSYGQEAQKYFRQTFFNDKDLQMLSMNLVEVFNNIFNHAESDILGYVITQYFPNENKLTFAVCDFGIGIANGVNVYLQNTTNNNLDHASAIEKSLERGFSIKSIPQNAGQGLSNVWDFTRNFNGQLRIFSNSGRVIATSMDPIQKTNLYPPFSGTLISASIDTKSLEEIDPDDGIFQF